VFSFSRELQGLLVLAAASHIFHRHREPVDSCKGLTGKPKGSLLPYCSESLQQNPIAAFMTHYWKDLQGWAKELKEF